VRGLEEMGGLELIKTLFLVGRSPDSQSLALAAFQALTGGGYLFTVSMRMFSYIGF